MGNAEEVGMRSRAARRASALALAGALFCSAASCRSGLDELVTTIARTQNVDEAVVRSALARHASTESDQLALAKQWQQTLPQEPLPNVATQVNSWEGVTDHALEQLRAAACSALVDIASSGMVPDGETFLREYLISVVLPPDRASEVASAFQELFNNAIAGDYDAVEVRFTLLELQYC